MKAIVLIEIDPETLQQFRPLGVKMNNEGKMEVENIDDAIMNELGWVQQSGISAYRIIMDDDILPNDADFGAFIKENIL